MLTKPQFERVRRLALELAGIELLPRHHEVLDRKVHRLGIPNSAGLDLVLHDVEAGKPAARQRFFKLIITNFTRFFRQPSHFELAANHLLHAAKQRGKGRCWCAGVATGEEPYSLAMMLITTSGTEKPPVDIIATDIDRDALEAARHGEYSERTLEGIAPENRKRFFVRAASIRRLRVAPSVRHLVEFQSLNLADAVWSIEGPLDVIFCRNVIMYLADARRKTVLERMASLVAEDGLFIIDPSEHLGRMEALFSSGKHGVYKRRSVVPAAGRAKERTKLELLRLQP